jgi:hypothetical protein
MDMTLISLAASSASVVAKALPALLEAVNKKKQPKITVEVDGRPTQIDATPELVELLRMSLHESVAVQAADNPIALSRAAAVDAVFKAPSSATTTVGGAALGISADEVVASARRRIELVFRINLGIAIALAVIFIGGIAGALVSSLVLGKSTWAVAFGGLSTVDLLGVYAFKPLKVINRALVSSQRLDAVHLRLREQLDGCRQLGTMEERMKCQTQIWEAIETQLASLAETDETAPARTSRRRRAG